VCELPLLPIEAVESTSGPDPQHALPVFVQRGDLAIAEAGGIRRVVPVHVQVVTVVSVQPVAGAKPHEPHVILQDAGYGVLGEPVLNREAFESQALSLCCAEETGGT
jgi:hypothetical protein